MNGKVSQIQRFPRGIADTENCWLRERSSKGGTTKNYRFFKGMERL